MPVTITPPAALPADRLRWRCPADWTPFETTATVEPSSGIRGQPHAVEALRYGLTTTSPGHHVFVRGLAGTGRATLLTEVMETCRPCADAVMDHVCVPRFEDPARPRMIALPHGTARDFARRVESLGRFVVRDLAGGLRTEAMQVRRAEIVREGDARFEAMLSPFEKSVAEAGAALVTVGEGGRGVPAVFPRLGDEPVPPEALRRARAEGAIDDETFARLTEAVKRLSGVLAGLLPELESIRESVARTLGELDAAEIKRQLAPRAARIVAEHPAEGVKEFIDELVAAVAEHGPPSPPPGPVAAPGDSAPEAGAGGGGGPTGDDIPVPAVFTVNVLRHHEDAEVAPVVVASAPSRAALFGTIEITGGETAAPHLAVRPGSLLLADGGFLVVEARDLVAAGNVWPVLARTLRSRRLEIEAAAEGPGPGSSISPDPVDLTTKVVLVGDGDVHAFLEAADPDFSLLFKVVADFDSTMARDAKAAMNYASVIARIAKEESLPPFSAGAIAALVEHGARVAGDGGRLTARLGRICDIAREAAWIAGQNEVAQVEASDVLEAVRRGRARASLPVRRFHTRLEDGTFNVRTDGAIVGQINGLATMRAGPLTYGFPQRITASVGPGTLGLVNVEHEAALSGAIHTKGFHILRGVLHHLLRLDHPLSLDGSIVFEQSYGGVDGDSASTAEACCLLSAMTGVPIRQDLAITGAIDQRGNVMAIGAVNEKIDGFHDACAARGLTGTQGVIIPASNVAELALREEVVEACAEGRFHVYPVARVEEALALLTGRAVDATDPDPSIVPAAGLLAEARQHVERLWRTSSADARD